MKYKCKDKHNSWEMNILKNWEKSYNAILKGTIEAEPASKVFAELYDEIFMKGEC